MNIKQLNMNNLTKEQMEILFEVSKNLNLAEDISSVVEKSLDWIIKFLQVERAIFVKYLIDENDFTIISARNLKKETISDLHLFSSGILREIVKSKKPLLHHDIQSDPHFSQYESIQIHQIKSILGVPIFQSENLWGVILVDSHKNRINFTEDNLFFLEFFGSLISLALNKIIQIQNLKDEYEILSNRLGAIDEIPEIVGVSQKTKDLSRMIHKVAKTDATVLITGESGVGKELVANAIHKLSNRNTKPFIAQFCGSIPDSLLESELFGYKRGAFTGANTDKKGLFEIANEGTFFLDEIADISTALQSKLLRVIENQEMISLGDTKVKKINVRIIAATNKDLKMLVKESKFREDLFYRLNVFPLSVPSLRERREDIPLLVKHFIQKCVDKNIGISDSAIRKLEKYSWPGNIRQLQNVVQRAMILCENNLIKAENIDLEETDSIFDFEGTLKDFEMMILERRLKEFNNNKVLTAESLGVSVRWIQLKMKEKESRE